MVTKNLVSDYGAVGNGVANDSPALDSWLTFARAQGATPVEIVLDSGKTFNFAGTSTLTDGIQNVTITATGASANNAYIGPVAAIPEDVTHSALIQSVSAGATSVTLLDAADVSKFTVGRWILICGLSLQESGYPPNWQWNEFRQITDVTGSVVSFSGALANDYLSTWPAPDRTAVTVTSASPAVISWVAHGFSATQGVLFTVAPGGSMPTGMTNGATYYVRATGLTADTFQISTLADGSAPVNTSSTGSGVIGHRQIADLLGPAAIVALPASFDTEQTIIGLTVTNATGSVVNGGRSLICDGVTWDAGCGPSAGKSIIFRNCDMGDPETEVDKQIEYLEFDNCTGTNLGFQSASVRACVVKGGSNIGTINGTPLDMTLQNSTFGEVRVGPNGYGHGRSVAITNCAITTGRSVNHYIAPSILSDFTGGTFRVPNSPIANALEVWRLFVPSFKYFYGYYDGAMHKTNDNGQVTSFKVLALRQDATYTYIDTDLSAIPTATFQGGQTQNAVAAYAAKTITQSGGGADLTQFQEPADASLRLIYRKI